MLSHSRHKALLEGFCSLSGRSGNWAVTLLSLSCYIYTELCYFAELLLYWTAVITPIKTRNIQSNSSLEYHQFIGSGSNREGLLEDILFLTFRLLVARLQASPDQISSAFRRNLALDNFRSLDPPGDFKLFLVCVKGKGQGGLNHKSVTFKHPQIWMALRRWWHPNHHLGKGLTDPQRN